MSDQENSKSATAVDLRVGRRIRLRRKMVGITQAVLGHQIGITSQQVQKYEKGVNRIGASRLERIAQVLGVPTSQFFGEGGAPVPALDRTLDRFLQLPESSALIGAFLEIKDTAIRRQIVEIVRSLKIIDAAACSEKAAAGKASEAPERT